MNNYELPVVWTAGSQELSDFFYRIIDRTTLSQRIKRHLHTVMMDHTAKVLPTSPGLEAISNDPEKVLSSASGILFNLGFFPDYFSEKERAYYGVLGANLYNRVGNLSGLEGFCEVSKKFARASNAITEIRVQVEFHSSLRNVDMKSDVPLRADPHVNYLLKRSLKGSYVATEVLKRLGIDVSSVSKRMQ